MNWIIPDGLQNISNVSSVTGSAQADKMEYESYRASMGRVIHEKVIYNTKYALNLS